MCCTANQARLRGLAALLAAIVIAGGCATEKVKTTGWTESTATAEPTATAETPAEAGKSERVAMEQRAGGADLPGKIEPTPMTVSAATAEQTAAAEKAAKAEKAKRVEMEKRAGGVDLLPPPDVKATIPAETKLTEVITDLDARHEWVGRKFASIVDTADKAFGEPRIEDAEQIVRAKIGLKAKVIQTEDTDWSVPSNFRIPLPALARRANIFIDIATNSDASNLSDVNAVTDSSSSSLSATYLKKITNNLDIGVTFDVYGGWDIGPKVKLRYNKRWDPWGLFLEQQVFVRTDDGWGGRTTANIDYELPDNASFIRWANRADYYEELYDRNYKSSIMYRRKFYGNTALSAEVGVEYNPYTGDPEIKHHDNPDPDDDHAYVKARVIGKVFRPWIEWELVPGYYYKWEQDEPWRWGIEARLSLMYESYLGGGIQ
jgi:hypothetical protein